MTWKRFTTSYTVFSVNYVAFFYLYNPQNIIYIHNMINVYLCESVDMNSDEGLRHSFEEVWRYLNSHGSAYITLESGKQVIARTGVTKKDNMVKKIIRFQFEEK